jgi:hypothetical protein
LTTGLQISGGLHRQCRIPRPLRGPAAPSYEQTQTIAIAIGMPTTKAPTIIKMKSESKFAPGRAFPTNMPNFSAANFGLRYRWP